MLAHLPELRQAWRLSHRFCRWDDAPDRPTAAQRLTTWEARVRASGLAEFLALIERPQALLRQAFGYRNSVNLRLRVLLPAG